MTSRAWVVIMQGGDGEKATRGGELGGTSHNGKPGLGDEKVS